MASVNFEKFKTAQSVKAVMKHCDKEQRQLTENHSNQDINKNMSCKNLQYSNTNYKSTCKRFDDRIAFLDTLENQNKRKDRVLCFGLEIPCPADLPADKEVDWMKQVNQILLQRFGRDNVMNLYFHRDEQHKYTDAETGKERISKNHIHSFVVPEIDGKLNGKEFSSKKNMIELNNQIQLMTQQQFGVDFMDGSKKKSKKSVESLKNASKQRETEELQKQAAERLTEANKRLVEVNNAITSLNAEKEAFEVYRQETTEKLTKTLYEANTMLKECKELHKNLKFQSESYLGNPISRIQERNMVKLDRNLELAYDIANQSRNKEEYQYG